MREVYMAGTLKLVKVIGGNEHTLAQTPLPVTELRHFKNIVSNVTQDALNVWAELWGELEGRVVSGITVLPEAKNGFNPSCGWPEFLEKMQLLKHYLDFVGRFSQQ
jgi:hypothetical protein